MDTTMYICAGLSFLICVILTPVLIPVLRRMKFGQVIREVGPKWHKGKNGIPTMGGIAFLLSSVVIAWIFCKDPAIRCGVLAAALFGLVGFLDDFISVVMKRNLGLNEKQKLVLQILIAVAFLVWGVHNGFITTTLFIPFAGVTWELSWFYIVFASILIVGFVNAVNLTDGLDGLAASVTILVTAFFAAAAMLLGHGEASYFAAAVTGGLVAFLIFNFNPAKVFMGDTGSLYLGGVVSVLAVLLKLELILVLVGLIYLIEALSVMLQVAYFKKTGKRIFLMAPIHHHFEMKGWKEKRIVAVFSFVTLLCCAAGMWAVLN